MKLAEYIEKQRIDLEKEINYFLSEKKRMVPVGLNSLTDSLDRLLHIIPKGKLLRGVQVLLAHELVHGTNSNGAIKTAAALEIIQAAVLIQDDFMDNDYIRRGQRSVFAQYMDIGKQQQNHDPLLYGQSMATCVGDIGFFLAYELLSQCSDQKEEVSKIVSLFSREWQLVGAGQMMDVDFASRNYEPAENEVMNIYRYKTARYSFSLPLIMGAVLAGADELIIKKLDILGETLGIIFQIKDDELGIFGDEKILGKPIGSDIRENKKTLLRSMLMNKTSEEEKKKLQYIFGNTQISFDDIAYVKKLMVSYGVQEVIQKKMEVLKKEVDEAINDLGVDNEYMSLLHEFVELVSSRKK